MAIRNYVGARYVPKLANPVEWQANTSYEAMVIVTYNNSSYTSKVPVPPTVGNPAENSTYWALTGNYNAQVEEYREDVKNVSEKLDSKVSISNTIKIVAVNTEYGGDSTLIVTPQGKTMLIDALTEQEVSNIVATLTANGVTHLDYCFISHYHDDHVGGFLSPALSQYINDKTTFILPQNLPNNPLLNENQKQNETDIKAMVTNKGCSIIQPTRELSILEIETGIYGQFYNVDHSIYYQDTIFNYNNCSLCFKLYNKKSTAFFSGDIATTAQERLVGTIGHVDIYKAQHHASDNFQNGQYLLELSPNIIYACTSSKNYEKWSASREFIAIITQYGYQLAQTALNGNVNLALEEYMGTAINAKSTGSYTIVTSIDTLLHTKIYGQVMPELTLQDLVNSIPYNTGFQFPLDTARFPKVLGSEFPSTAYFFSGWKTHNNWYFITVTDLADASVFYIQVKNGSPTLISTLEKYMWFETGNIEPKATLTTFAQMDNKYGAIVSGGNITGLTSWNKLELYIGARGTEPQTVSLKIFGQDYNFYTQGGDLTYRFSLVIPKIGYTRANTYTIVNNSLNTTVNIQGKITRLIG